MSLRKTTLFIIAMILIGLIVVLLGSLNAILPPYFQRQEENDALLNTRRGLAAFDARLDELQRISLLWNADNSGSVDWSVGVHNDVPGLPDDQTLTALDVDLIATFDENGTLRSSKYLPLDAQVYANIPADMVPQLKQMASGANDRSLRRGFMQTEASPLMLIVSPSAEGMLLVGRYFDSSVQQALDAELKLVVNITPYVNAPAGSEVFSIQNQLIESGQPVVQIISNDLVAGYGLLKDPLGNPGYIIQIDQLRTYYQNSQMILNYLIITVVSSTVIFSIMTFLLIENLILRRLSKLNTEVQSIAIDGHSKSRVTVTRKDELANLSRNINQMLNRLEKTQAELETSYDLVRQGRKRLEDLSRRLVDTQEEERHSIALELHDEIGQSLTALKLQLAAIAARPSTANADDLKNMQLLLNDLIDRVRNLSLQLRPAMLDDLGLLPTLLWHFEEFEKQTGIKVSFKHKNLGKTRFAPAMEVGVYRIVQESLTNVARHAAINRASVTMERMPDHLHLEISDRGKGFSVEKALLKPNSSGLSGMRERVTVLGGRLEITSQPMKGTSLVIDLPFTGWLERRRNARHHPVG